MFHEGISYHYFSPIVPHIYIFIKKGYRGIWQQSSPNSVLKNNGNTEPQSFMLMRFFISGLWLHLCRIVGCSVLLRDKRCRPKLGDVSPRLGKKSCDSGVSFASVCNWSSEAHELSAFSSVIFYGLVWKCASKITRLWTFNSFDKFKISSRVFYFY